MSDSISKIIFSGASWITIQTAGTKIISFVSQLILAWILLPEDFGKISLTYTITNIGFLIQSFGLTDVLVSRSKSYGIYLNLAKTVSLIAAFLGFFITCILGVIGGYVYNDSEISILVFIYCFSIPFNAYSVIPDSKLRIDLRFKELSFASVLEIFFRQLITIAFAYMGFGVYSFVIAPIISSFIRCFYLFYITKISITVKATLRRWKYLITNSSWGFVYALCQRVIFQSDYAILGLFASQHIVGIYYMAYSLSSQVIGFLTANLSSVFFPVLKTISSPSNQGIASILLRSTTYMATIGIPFALWQGVCAEPLIKIFLSEKWIEAIPIVEILSLGMGFRVVSSFWEVALRIRSKFMKQALYSIYSSIFFILFLSTFSYWGGIKGTAWAVTLFYFISSPILLYFSFKTYNIHLKDIIKIFLKYFCIGLCAFLPLFILCKNINSQPINLLLNGIISPFLYLGLINIFAKKEVNEIFQKIKSII